MVAAAYPRRWRASRNVLAAVIGGVVLLALIASSLLSFVFQGVPHRATIYGLPAVGLAVGAGFFALRGLAERAESRRTDLLRAAVLAGLGLGCWLLVIDVITLTASAGTAVAAACALACVPTTALGLLVVRRLDRNEKEPWRLVLVAAVWGAVAATSLAIWGETLWDFFAVRLLVPGPGFDASTAYSAGIFEELAKGIALVLLYLAMRNEFDDVVDGIVYGAAVGLGFNFMESIGYMTHLYSVFAGEGQGAAAAAVQWYGRQVLGLFLGHATYTALIGAGLGIARQLARPRQRVLAIGCGFLAAIAAHFAWDAWGSFFPISRSAFGLVEVHLRTLAMDGPFAAAVLLMLGMGLLLEGRGLAASLAAEAAGGSGSILPEEVPVLVHPWRRLQARLRAFTRDGLAAYLRVARLQVAQLDLGMELWHRERGEIEEPLEAEARLRRHVLALRSGTGGPMEAQGR